MMVLVMAWLEGFPWQLDGWAVLGTRVGCNESADEVPTDGCEGLVCGSGKVRWILDC